MDDDDHRGGDSGEGDQRKDRNPNDFPALPKQQYDYEGNQVVEDRSMDPSSPSYVNMLKKKLPSPPYPYTSPSPTSSRPRTGSGTNTTGPFGYDVGYRRKDRVGAQSPLPSPPIPLAPRPTFKRMINSHSEFPALPLKMPITTSRKVQQQQGSQDGGIHSSSYFKGKTEGARVADGSDSDSSSGADDADLDQSELDTVDSKLTLILDEAHQIERDVAASLEQLSGSLGLGLELGSAMEGMDESAIGAAAAAGETKHFSNVEFEKLKVENEFIREAIGVPAERGVESPMVNDKFGLLQLARAHLPVVAGIDKHEPEPELCRDLVVGEDFSKFVADLSPSAEHGGGIISLFNDSPLIPSVLDMAEKEHSKKYDLKNIGNILRLPPVQVEKLSNEQLFFLFYIFVQESLQIVAARELFKRGWRYHKVAQFWIYRDTAQPKNRITQTDTYEIGSYIYFIPQQWKFTSVRNAKLEYQHLAPDNYSGEVGPFDFASTFCQETFRNVPSPGPLMSMEPTFFGVCGLGYGPRPSDELNSPTASPSPRISPLPESGHEYDEDGSSYSYSSATTTSSSETTSSSSSPSPQPQPGNYENQAPSPQPQPGNYENQAPSPSPSLFQLQQLHTLHQQQFLLPRGQFRPYIPYPSLPPIIPNAVNYTQNYFPNYNYTQQIQNEQYLLCPGSQGPVRPTIPFVRPTAAVMPGHVFGHHQPYPMEYEHDRRLRVPVPNIVFLPGSPNHPRAYTPSPNQYYASPTYGEQGDNQGQQY